jgi:hypothetical protein
VAGCAPTGAEIFAERRFQAFLDSSLILLEIWAAWSTKRQFVGGLEWRAADAADDRRTVTANQRIRDNPGAVGTPELRGLGWRWGGGVFLKLHPRKA